MSRSILRKYNLPVRRVLSHSSAVLNITKLIHNNEHLNTKSARRVRTQGQSYLSYLSDLRSSSTQDFVDLLCCVVDIKRDDGGGYFILCDGSSEVKLNFTYEYVVTHFKTYHEKSHPSNTGKLPISQSS